ncbi:Helix-turn-helix domain-containing protein [Paenibacillus sp. UNC496MF]|uniref:helix-turn-helix domain-containing protein n=1 Tax=Paenibacillus sp. UNC496MF TaxID=1502753 RepID=UPI0008E469C6|nr:helix-turn-helix domain-containing protein [Paenibacillus sp. UNC496MF]SFI79230.1 Helix-turn-helix domain-containing protein [Paenibacillus sp. UNC496MF]
MLKVMVVDDEPWGRKSVGKMIGELALDVEVAAEARNGAEALELIPIVKPQIVVTDMNMPVMNGQRLLEELYRRHNEIKVIVISGHSQFEYMRAAIAFQACEYVLKPVSLAELKNALVKAMELSRSHLSAQERRRFAGEMRQLRTETFLQHVTARRIANASDILAQSAELLPVPPAAGYRVAVCMLRRFGDLSATKFGGNSDLLMYSVDNMLRELAAGGEALVYKSDDKTKLCVLLPEPAYGLDGAARLLAPFHDAVSRMLDSGVAAGLSAPYDRLERLPEAFAEANARLLAGPLREAGFSLVAADGPHGAGGAPAPEVLSGFDAKLLQQALAAGQAGTARRLLGELLRRIEAAPGLTIQGAQRELRRLADIASGELPGLGQRAEADAFAPRAADAVLSEAGARGFVEALAAAVEERLGSRPAADAPNPVRDVAAYLDAHYFEDVSLIDVATRYHMDASYLSKQFKAVTGENFIEYVTRKRMEKACELLRGSELKINDISELVGYENQRYFSQVFKKFTGLTPSEYRDGAAAASPDAKN